MKRWLSVSFALGSFFGVVLVSIFTLLHLQFGSLNVPSVPVAAQAATTTSAVDESFAAAETFFKEKGISLSTTPATPLPWATWSTFESTATPEVRKAAVMAHEEWSRYSNEVLANSGLKAVYLIKDLNVNGQARSGMPDPEVTHSLYFDVSEQYLNSEGGSYMRRTFHHEFSHLIEYHLFDSYAPKDSVWSGCNATGLKYGNGGAAMYANADYAHKWHPQKGFVNGYATSGIEEDKAEMFAYYMTDASTLRDLANKDENIACKLHQTELLLQKL